MFEVINERVAKGMSDSYLKGMRAGLSMAIEMLEEVINADQPGWHHAEDYRCRLSRMLKDDEMWKRIKEEMQQEQEKTWPKAKR